MILKRGSKGAKVVELQRALTLLGHNLDDDGIFGKGTEEAVIAFQNSHGLEPDGKVGKKTASAIIELAVEPEAEPEKTVKQPWMDLAKTFIGMQEIVRSEHNPEIVQFWKDIKRGGIKNDETPWCAAYVGAMLERNGIRSSRFESAKSYLDWGVKLDKPVDGCVVVFTRSGGGHVGFVVGQTKTGNLLVLGGNQGDAVNIKEFKRNRVKGYRYPVGFEPSDTLTVGDSKELSKNEA